MSNLTSSISFIIPAKNESANIKRCIDSINNCRKHDVEVEILVVDNGSTDDTVTISESLGAKVFVKPELRISGLRNFGAQQAKGEFLGFIDADVAIAEDWIENALKGFKREEVAMTGSSPSIPEDSNWVVRTWHLQIQARPQSTEREWLASMNILVRKSVFDEIGGFDEELVTCEDVDLGYRIIQKNFKILSDANIKAIHYGEAQDLGHLFRKEAWRGTSNISGALKHGFQAGELPSLLQPVITLLGILLMAFGLLLWVQEAFLLGILLFCSFPFAKACHLSLKLNSFANFWRLLIIWSVYAVARAKSFLIELKSLLLKP